MSTLPQTSAPRVCVYCDTAYLAPAVDRLRIPWFVPGGELVALATTVAGLEVDPHPCPVCGLSQHERVVWARGNALLLAALAGGLLCAPVAVLAAATGSSAWAVWGLAAVGWVYLAAVTAALRWDINRDPAANRAKADAALRAGRLAVLVPGDPRAAAAHPLRTRRSAFEAVLLGLLTLAVAQLPSAEVHRLARGWPLNEGTDPGVIGPGERVRLHFPNAFSGVGGFWRGQQVNATVTNAAEVGLADAKLPASPKDRPWAGPLKTSNGVNHSWGAEVEVVAPDNPDIAGRTLQIRVDMAITAPVAVGNKYVVQGFELERTRSLAVADTPGAGEEYRRVVLVSLVGGVAACAALSLVLYFRLFVTPAKSRRA